MVGLTAWLHGAVLALLKLAGVIAALALLRVLLWFLNIFVLLPPFDPLAKLPGPHGKFLQSHFNEVMKYG